MAASGTDDRAERLLRLREQIAAEISRRDLASPEWEERGDGHHHPAEAASDATLREQELREQLRLRQRQEALQAALVAIEDGTYGLCADCGDPIPEGRLRRLPDATRCVPCQSRADRRGGR